MNIRYTTLDEQYHEANHAIAPLLHLRSLLDDAGASPPAPSEDDNDNDSDDNDDSTTDTDDDDDSNSDATNYYN